jgi:hypothetical protein
MSAKASPVRKIIIYPPKDRSSRPRRTSIIGNVAFYGATTGEALHQRHRRRTLLRAQLRRQGRRRRRGRPRLRIHDRRPGDLSWAPPAATSGPACPAASPTSMTSTATSRNASTARWSTSTASSSASDADIAKVKAASKNTSPSPVPPAENSSSKTGMPSCPPSSVKVLPRDYERMLELLPQGRGTGADRRRGRHGRFAKTSRTFGGNEMNLPKTQLEGRLPRDEDTRRLRFLDIAFGSLRELHYLRLGYLRDASASTGESLLAHPSH